MVDEEIEPTAAAALTNEATEAPRVRRVTDQISELAAILHANGRDDSFIRSELGLSTSQLRRLKKQESWLTIAEGYRDRAATVSANHRSRMLDLVEQSYASLADVMRDEKNAKARLDAIKWVQEQAQVASVQKESADVNVNLGFQKNNIAVTQNIAAVLSDLKDVIPAVLDLDDSKHVREGDEALPQATLSQVADAERRAEIIEAEFAGDGTDEDL